MSLLIDPLGISSALTKAHADDEKMRKTHTGMAHFAGTGPEGRSCRECAHWMFKSDGYYSKSGKFANQIKPHRCAKFSQLSAGRAGDAVPANASACKYFEAAPIARAAVRPT